MGGIKRKFTCVGTLCALAALALLFTGCQGDNQATASTTLAAPSVSTSSTESTADTTTTAPPAEPDLGVLIKQMAAPYPDGDSRYVSSNPYDYTKDNPAFDAIVARGYDALPGLEADLTAGGLGNYLDCIAIEKITKCDLKEFTQYAWGDAISFRTQWNSYLKQMPSAVMTAFALSSYAPPKPIGLEKLGAPAVPYVIDQAKRTGVWNESEVVGTLQSLLLNARPAATIAEFAQFNATTIEKLRAYVENR